MRLRTGQAHRGREHDRRRRQDADVRGREPVGARCHGQEGVTFSRQSLLPALSFFRTNLPASSDFFKAELPASTSALAVVPLSGSVRHLRLLLAACTSEGHHSAHVRLIALICACGASVLLTEILLPLQHPARLVCTGWVLLLLHCNISVHTADWDSTATAAHSDAAFALHRQRAHCWLCARSHGC